jgi:hypothetical protein
MFIICLVGMKIEGNKYVTIFQIYFEYWNVSNLVGQI